MVVNQKLFYLLIAAVFLLSARLIYISRTSDEDNAALAKFKEILRIEEGPAWPVLKSHAVQPPSGEKRTVYELCSDNNVIFLLTELKDAKGNVTGVAMAPKFGPDSMVERCDQKQAFETRRELLEK